MEHFLEDIFGYFRIFFKWVKYLSEFDEDFIKSYNGKSKEVYLPEVDIQYPEELLELSDHLPFLSERIKIENVEKLVANLHDKNEYVIQIRNLKQALNDELISKKFIKP